MLLKTPAPIVADRESERAVQSALETVMAGRTSVVIAHRLSTVQQADRIAVLEGGRVAELGTPAELRAREGGSFARLLAAQELAH